MFMTDQIGDWKRSHYTAEVPSKDGEEVTVMGWVREVRDIGKLKFIVLADREGSVQITAKKGETAEATMKKIDTLTRESVVAIKGKIKANKQAPGGREISPEEIRILSLSEQPLPLEVTGKTPALLDTRLDERVLDLRKPENQAIFRIGARMLAGMRHYLIENHFIETFTPALMGAPSESGAELFVVPYFDKEAYLRQDPMLHRQLCILGGFDKVFETGPSWRAELSHTSRHMCEHRNFAAEISFIKDEHETMRLEEQVIVSGIKQVLKDCKPQLELLKVELEAPKTPFPELKFPDVYDILAQFGKKLKIGEDYDSESEKILAKYVKEKYKTDFFFVNKFPYSVKPFYVMKDDETYARSVDFIYKGLEISSGGQREHRYDVLVKQAKEKKMNLQHLEWYLKFFKYGVPPHGGFSIGLERILMQMVGLENVREATLFPRDTKRLLP